MNFYRSLDQKFFPERAALIPKIEEWRKRGPVVFTNGVFDLLHTGHISYLCKARDLGGALVVALNADESVRRLKGEGRPLNKAEDRARVLSALACVDAVTIFPEDTPVATIELLKPDIHTKGADYAGRTIPEEAVVKAYGGRVVLIDFVEGYSTTSTIQKSRG